ncbi:endonuclease/exonuclease/phosphatase family protein [Besnoitia besnoiti]|uniref:Endonuclease/exonuclease/phosphatase family protein n=1 Tax=Besnoitia besnoiti TaxID=94643 RepID=A0A2A9MKU6_BESBE|nr:endonuclease/exonuclease/phosphatase family protein [Besnoitia besnoiti]PFH38579.1 endonuclease/exonuclease/phosphatase family protein [Besnoitia besnoiti]
MADARREADGARTASAAHRSQPASSLHGVGGAPRRDAHDTRSFADDLAEIRRMRALQYREHKEQSQATSARSSPPARPPTAAGAEGPGGGTRSEAAAAEALWRPFARDRKLEEAVLLQGAAGETRGDGGVSSDERLRFSLLAASLARAARESGLSGRSESWPTSWQPFTGDGRRLSEERERKTRRDEATGLSSAERGDKRAKAAERREKEELRRPPVQRPAAARESSDLSRENRTRGDAAPATNKERPETRAAAPLGEADDVLVLGEGHAMQASPSPTEERGDHPLIWSSQFDVLTWNLDGLDEVALRPRTAAVAATVKALRPAVVMLQEVIGDSLALLTRHLSPLYHLYTPASPLRAAASAPAACAAPEGCPYFCVLMLCREQMLPLADCDGARTEWFPQSQMGRHMLGVVAAPMSWPDDRLLFLTSHLESMKEFREERLRQFTRCMQVITRSFAGVADAGDAPEAPKPAEAGRRPAPAQAGDERGACGGEESREGEKERKEEKAGDEAAALGPAYAAVFGGDTNLRDSELVEGAGDSQEGGCRKGRVQGEQTSGGRRKTEPAASSRVPASVRDVWEVLGRPKECRYTWDMFRNDNKQMKWKTRLRFDRLYWWSPRAPASEALVSSSSCAPAAGDREDGRAASAEKDATTRNCATWAPVSLHLVGVNRLPTCGRFPSDHFGLLARFKREAPASQK